ncbi:hypothetical protein MJO28_009018 [Puccinia striiformis f. sp. tritici]|uniref:Uncharacterized protein n=1 Tax=Puccinia striiformis f. sp. tritici TaxID=168172 RepID=A0ACC0ECN5_9BASI|nr:hypothetical protein MJO28_009018 [Puccinia striiformis f. sp. tritici]
MDSVNNHDQYNISWLSDKHHHRVCYFIQLAILSTPPIHGRGGPKFGCFEAGLVRLEPIEFSDNDQNRRTLTHDPADSGHITSKKPQRPTRNFLGTLYVFFSSFLLCFASPTLHNLPVKKLRQKASHSARASGSNSSPYYRFSTLNNALNIHEEQSTSRTGGLIDVAKRNRQLFHLLLRALCVMITMITSGILVILGITTTGDILRDPHWRAMMVWLSTVATAWSAIPIAWQCWRLCEEDLGSTSPVADKAKCASLAAAEEAVCMSIILTKPSQVAEGSIEIRLNPDDTIPTRSSPTKLTSFVESPEKLRPSHSTSYAEDTIDIRLNPDDIVHTPSSPTLAGSFVESLEKSRPSHSTA